MKIIVAACALVLTAATGVAAQSVDPPVFTISYAVRARGIDVGGATYALSVRNRTYQATFARRMTGPARTLLGASQDFTYSAQGQVDADGQIRPVAYQHQGGRGHRVVHVAFAGDQITTIATPVMGMGHPPATQAQKAGAIDQVSMFAQMLMVHGAPCRQSVRVFMDGRTRFDLVFSPNGRQRVSIAGFRGDAFRCSVQFQPVAGFSDPQQPARLTFLFAPLNGYFVPLSIEMPTDDVGIVRLEARTFRIEISR